MPGITLPEVDHFVPVTPSKEPIDFVDLHKVDLSTYDDGLEARRALAEQVRQAMTTQGFFTLLNHGISQEEIERQVDIGHTILERTSEEEKQRLRAPIREEGNYFGFKPRGVWTVDGKKTDKIEQFNVYRDLSIREQPKTFEPYRQEVQSFIDTTHKGVLYKLLRLFAIALELDDEDYLVKLHSYDGQDSSWLRYMKYYDEQKGNDGGKSVWLQGHQDFPSLTLLFSQSMTSLQVRDVNDSAEWSTSFHVFPNPMSLNVRLV
jgi:isopenicillin N synthase-like dioxygenase